MLLRCVIVIAVVSRLAAPQTAPEASASRAYYGLDKRGIVRTPPPGAPKAAAPTPAPRLGIRYNLLDVDPKGARPPSVVPSDSIWKVGQCAAVRIEANRPGHVYVLAQGSSGAWQPLIPSPDAVPEPLRVEPYSPATIPSEHCFEIHPPAGKERLFIVVSERKQDMAELETVLRRRAAAPEMLTTRLNDQVGKLRNELRGRDLKIQKVAKPESARETPHSVFVVAADSRPNDRLIVELEIEHR